MSLDGFIEGPNGEYDWCPPPSKTEMDDFMDKIDVILMGRKSFELMGPNAFPGKKVYVFSNTLKKAEGENTYAGVTIGPQPGGHLADIQVLEALARVDQDIAVGLETLKDVNLVEQGRVLDDDGVRRHDGLTQTDLLGIDTTEGDDWGARALRTEAGEGLGVLAFEKGGD